MIVNAHRGARGMNVKGCLATITAVLTTTHAVCNDAGRPIEDLGGGARRTASPTVGERCTLLVPWDPWLGWCQDVAYSRGLICVGSGVAIGCRPRLTASMMILAPRPRITMSAII